MMKSRGWFVLLACAMLAAGCGEAGPKTYKLQGEVSYDGDPVTDGNISFVSQDPAIVDDSAPIKDGHYEANVKAGPKKVVIHATREVGEVDPAMGARNRESYIPPQYSTAGMTTLELDVQADGVKDFHLPKP